jgi:hypothetical protein
MPIPTRTTTSPTGLQVKTHVKVGGWGGSTTRRWCGPPARPQALRSRRTSRRDFRPVTVLLTILFLSDTYGGRVHDKRIAEATPYPPSCWE